MKIYTKTGDKGVTSLYDGNRVSKTSYVFDVLGEIDELSSRLGIVCALDKEDYITDQLRIIQRKLQDINSILATFETQKRKLPEILDTDIKFLEDNIDMFSSNTPTLKNFILPGVTIPDSHLHLCRSQTRKIERMLWKFTGDCKIQSENKTIYRPSGLDENILKYFNRLSDYFFAGARFVCYLHKKKDFFLL
jgi:cob(I)alamin adenosyltransferase